MNAVILLLVAFSALLYQSVTGQTVPAGQFPADLTEEHKIRLINYSMDAFRKQSNSTYGQRTVYINVEGITSQVVSGGVLYRLQIVIGKTRCEKDQGDGTCKIKDASTHKRCVFTVYERPWEKFVETKVASCS